AVVINNQDQVVELMVSGKHYCLPCGTLIAFAVAHENEDPPWELFPFAHKRHACTNRQSVAQGSGRELNTGHTMKRYVAPQFAPVLPKIGQIGQRHKASLSQGRISDCSSMAFAYD